MLVIKNHLGLSNIHGVGVFAGEDIKKGQIIWKKQGFDQIIDIKQLEALDLEARNYIEELAYRINETQIILPCDNTRFINHDDDPNIDNSISDDYSLAARDIKKDQELYCNYVELNPLYQSLPYVGAYKKK
jgi:SET domain-containing protein